MFLNVCSVASVVECTVYCCCEADVILFCPCLRLPLWGVWSWREYWSWHGLVVLYDVVVVDDVRGWLIVKYKYIVDNL